MHFTAQQRTFIQAVRDSRKPLYLRATAGAGKTTTIKEAAWHVPATEKAAYFVYNRTAREEVGPGLPPHVPARTLHADGAGELARTGLNTEIQQGKSLKLAQTLFPASPRSAQRYYAKIWDTAREKYLTPSSNPEALLAFCSKFGLELPDGSSDRVKLLEGVQKLLSLFTQVSLNDWRSGNGPDFTDQLWLPIQLGLGRSKYRTLFVDEAQDLSPLRQKYLLHVTGRLTENTPQGRLILVGDPDQAVYQYAGADPEGMARLAQDIGATEFPLSVSWRCPASHIAVARHASKFIEPSPSAKVGVIEHVPAEQLKNTLRKGQTVLSRTNSPLVRLALDLLGRNVSVDYRGRDLDKQLGGIAREAFQAPFTAENAACLLQPHLERRAAPLLKAQSEGDAEARRQLRDLEDLFDCIALLAERCAYRGHGNLESILGLIRTLCSPGGDVVLSTIHRAKGLEWHDVTLLFPETLPLRNGDPEEERCILFVALTRSKNILRFAYGQAAWDADTRVQAWAKGQGWMEENELEEPVSTAVHAPQPAAPVETRTYVFPEPQVLSADFSEDERKLIVQAQLRLQASRLARSPGGQPLKLQDQRAFRLFHGNDLLDMKTVRRILYALQEMKRPKLTEWAAESLNMIEKQDYAFVLGDAGRLRDLEHYLKSVNMAASWVTGGRQGMIVFEVMTIKSYLSRKATIKRRGKTVLSLQVGEQVLKFDPATGEKLGCPFELWSTFARVS